MKHYQIVMQSCDSDNSTVLTHEPVKKSIAWDMLEVIRRSWQFACYTITSDINGFVVSDKISWLYRFYSEEVEVQK